MGGTQEYSFAQPRGCLKSILVKKKFSNPVLNTPSAQVCTAGEGAPPCRWAQMSLASVTSVAKAAEDDRIRRTYEVEDLDATFALAVGRRMRMAWRGFWTLCSETFALEFGSTSVFYEVGVSIALVLPLTVLCTWVTVTHGYTFGWEIYAFISFLLAFLLIFRLQTAYARYWEARTILAESKTSIISCGLLAVTQYHRHYGDPSDEVKLCVEGVHRYLCLYYFTLVNHLRFGDNGDCRQPNIEHYVTEPELELLRKKRGVLAPIKVVKWIGAQLCHMESMGYISPLQLHETNEGLEGMIEAFVGLEKIKNCKVPFTMDPPVLPSPSPPVLPLPES